MEGENPVYLKVGYYESLGAKREVLSSEASLLNLIKIMRRYNSLKKEELRIRASIYKTIKELNSKVRETKSYFPFFEIPEKFKKKEPRVKKESVHKVDKKIPQIQLPPQKKQDIHLESELMDIQNRLREIERL